MNWHQTGHRIQRTGFEVLGFGLLFIVLAQAAIWPKDAHGDNDPPKMPPTNLQETAPNTPIEHFVVLMQENHTFDNYFGTYPGADGFLEGTCLPVDLTGETSTECIEPFHIGDYPISDLDHSSAAHRAQYNDGKMDGFVDYMRAQGFDYKLTMGYYDDRDIPYMWNVADEYVLFDRFFSSAAGGSRVNHMFWVTATAGNPLKDAVPEGGYGDLSTIFDRLEEKGISWKFYVQNYDPTINLRTSTEEVAPRPQTVWVPLLNYARYLDSPELSAHIVHLDEYFDDLAQGTLPAVSFIVPSGASEHPPGSVQSGQRFVKNLITQLMRSTSWDTSAFVWTYDDWGGWYDHVAPPQVDEFGYGFRVPTLLISPYAKRAYVDSTTLDFTSLLRFIEDNWGLEPLAERDAKADSIASGFDFQQKPRLPVLLSESRTELSHRSTNTTAVYVLYTIAALAPVLLVAFISQTDKHRHPKE
jgi:phospholipase C